MSSFQPQHPQTIGRYQIVRPLGSGAMGDVYLATDPHIDRQLAIKTVRVVGANEADIAERKQRLLREARAAGKLLHPNVVALFDAAEADGVLYLAFEFVDGVDLAKRAASAPPLTLRQVLDMAREVATALDFAHHHQIVHRDIKPSNILIGPGGEAKVADFGIAKVSDSTELTRTGSVVGSPQYMSPEQVRGEGLDGRSDLFSLGVVLYELLCRLRPFGGDTLSTLVFEILAKEPPTVDQLRPGLPARLVSLVHRLLSKDRDHRPASAREVMAELAEITASTAAGELDQPAAPQGSSEGATVRMPSSGGVAVPPPPPPPPGGPATTPPSPAHRPAGVPRTSTLAVGPPPVPPSGVAPLSSVPGTSASSPVVPMHGTPASVASTPAPSAPMAPAPVAPAPAIPATQPGRPSPLETGTYSGPGRRLPLFLVAALVVALGAGFGLSRFLASSGGATSPPDASAASGAAESGAAPGSPESEGAVAAGSSSSTGPDPAEVDPGATGAGAGLEASVVDPASAAATPAGSSSRASDVSSSSVPPPSDPPPSSDTARSTPPETPPPSRQPVTRTPPRQPPPAQPRPDQHLPEPTGSGSTAAAGSEAPADTQTAPPTPVPEANPREAAFDAAARGARQEITVGRRLRFDVEPAETVVKIQQRGERSIVQGEVRDYEAGEEDARDLELPADGDFLVTLHHPSFPEVVYFVHADAGQGSRAHVVRLKMASAARAARGPSGPETVRASRGVFFSGTPKDAVVFVDGERRGAASRWPGGKGLSRARKSLRLKPGRHTIRLEAPGRKPLELTAIIGSGAKLRFNEVIFRLEPAS